MGQRLHRRGPYHPATVLVDREAHGVQPSVVRCRAREVQRHPGGALVDALETFVSVRQVQQIGVLIELASAVGFFDADTARQHHSGFDRCQAERIVVAGRKRRQGGGQVVAADGKILEFLPLPVGGIASDEEPETIAAQEKRLNKAAQELGSTLSEPLMYMFFLPITAIPDYAITDVGPVDYTNLTIFDPILNLREQ